MPSVAVSTSEPPARYEETSVSFQSPTPASHTLFPGGSKFSPRCILLGSELVSAAEQGMCDIEGLLQNFMITVHPSKYVL